MRNILKRKNDKGKLFFRIDRRTKEGYYKIQKGVSQFKYCEKVILEGFDRFPTGFWTKGGYGLTGAGSFLLQELFAKYGKKISLKITTYGKSKLDGRGRKTSIVIRHKDLVRANSHARAIKKIRNEEVRAEARQFLWQQFSRQFKGYKGARPEYAPGTLASTLDQKGLNARLNPEDRIKLEEFIPDYLSNISGTLRAK